MKTLISGHTWKNLGPLTTREKSSGNKVIRINYEDRAKPSQVWDLEKDFMSAISQRRISFRLR